IFSSLLTDGYQNKMESLQLHCILNSNSMACSFAVGAGFLAFLSCLDFLVLHTQETLIAGTRFRLPSILWAVVWFVGFCFLANQWQHSPPKEFLLGSSSAQAAIAFTFFSILVWIFQAYLAFQDLRNDAPVPYKRSLDEGGTVLTTLPLPSTTSPVNMPTTGPNSLSYASSALSPCLTAPKVPLLAMMPDN
uniref:Synaptogyrin 4 n=1 Tax=Nomascus leucogenys TaxID=61853 RepID=G1QWL3_NOMLE